MRKKMLVLLAASAFLVMACDASGLVRQFLPQKQVEQAQATLEAALPTVAAVATTQAPASVNQAVPTKSTGSGTTGNALSDALNKAKSATKYRIQMSWIFGGMESGKYVEQPFIDLTGEVDGAKSHMTSKGGLLAMLAQDDKTPLEIVEADGKTYMKGVGLFGMADPKQWYISDDSTTSGFADMAKPDEYNSWISGAKAGDIKKIRTESLDNQSCDVYLYDVKNVKDASIIGLLGSAQDKSDFGAVDKGEINIWLCGDGYVHKFLLDYEGHNSTDATQKAAMKMNIHIWDYNNSAISVQVPTDAKPMPGSK